MAQITITEIADGVEVQFPKDRALIDSLKSTFPKARFDSAKLCWRIPGKMAARRAARWVGECETAAQQAIQAELKARQDAEFERPIQSKRVRRGIAGWLVSTPYSASIVAMLRKIPGAAFNKEGKVWVVPYIATQSLAAIVPELERISQAIEDQNAAEKAAREAEYARERAERAAKRDAAAAHRFVCMLENLPKIGSTLRIYGKVVLVTEHGKTWYMTEDYADAFAGDFLGHEGERCCYVYYRDATAEEVASLEAREVAAAQAAAEKAAARASLRQMEMRAEQEGERPDGSRVLGGETLIEVDRANRIYGGGTWWVAAEDGLWFVRNNGMDGDDWSRNNVLTGGAGAIGCRLPRNSEMEAELRRIAALIGA